MRSVSVLAAIAAILMTSAASADSDEVTRLREELEQTKAAMEQLEARLAAMEAREQQQGPAAELARTGELPPPAVVGSSPNAFNPAISAVLEGSYNAYSRDPENAVVSGFPLDEEATLPNEGFSLGESELNLSANIDSLFYGSFTAALEDDAGDTEVAVEEAFLETLSLPYGVKLKAGRMFPVFGYLNEIHAHVDAFVDRPLPYRAFLGGDNLRDDGVQLSVLLPTDLYAEVGGGAFRGIGYPAGGSGNDGVGTTTLFARVGGDVSVSQSWIAGLSYLRGDGVDRETDDLVFNGTTRVYALDAKYTWAPNGNLANRYLMLQAEYLWNNADGNYNQVNYDEDSDGWYAQAVYKLRPQWKIGYRYSRLGPPSVPAGLADTALDSLGHDPRTQSVLIEWEHSEFSSLRLQYTRDDSGPEPIDEGVLRYTINMGAHGAHPY